MKITIDTDDLRVDILEEDDETVTAMLLSEKRRLPYGTIKMEKVCEGWYMATDWEVGLNGKAYMSLKPERTESTQKSKKNQVDCDQGIKYSRRI